MARYKVTQMDYVGRGLPPDTGINYYDDVDTAVDHLAVHNSDIASCRSVEPGKPDRTATADEEFDKMVDERPPSEVLEAGGKWIEVRRDGTQFIVERED